ncbi:taurine dioxygenase [Dongia soli]|uniref:Taurine dioxygenase n=1 Tax=Dongia soli TaxID=600628 RepID=A0ABU5EAF5_9PROT|nr:taurine dioxygenase [Dongia soli]MDY0883332.1 taurine dioxygenase [Dongia soli]
MSNRTIADRITVTPLSPTIGALIGNVDLAAELDERAIERLTHALLTHQVIFFEDQHLTSQQQRDFAKRFGKLHIHPLYPNVQGAEEIIILDTHNDNPPDNDNWHTDVTFIETPPMGAILYARELPPVGGDTTWSSMTAAYESLSPAFRAFLDGLYAEHDFEKSFPRERYGTTPEDEKRWLKTRETHKPMTHPVVRTHPVTGKKGLFVNEGFTTRIKDLSKTESDAVLRLLFAHIAKPEFTIRWHWKQNAIAFSDNRCTQHYALADYLPHRRIMHRATIIGDRPV